MFGVGVRPPTIASFFAPLPMTTTGLPM